MYILHQENILHYSEKINETINGDNEKSPCCTDLMGAMLQQ